MAGKHDKVKDKDRSSILFKDLTKCAVCRSTDKVALHEIFYGTANRPKSKEDGMICPLCFKHHNGSSVGVHYNKFFDTSLKIRGQKAWEDKYISDNGCSLEDAREAFIKRYGQNYIMEGDN